MPLDSYNNLKASLTTYTGANNIQVVADDAIDIAESQMYANDKAPLRLRSMEQRSTATLSTSSRYLALPDDYLAPRRLTVTVASRECDIKFRAADQLIAVPDSGIPRFYTVTSQIELDRVPDSAYTVEIQYYKKLTALSDANTTNDILTNYPQIYLYGCLHVVNDFSAEEDKASYFEGKFIGAIKGANKQDKKGRYGSAPVMRTEGATP